MMEADVFFARGVLKLWRRVAARKTCICLRNLAGS